MSEMKMNDNENIKDIASEDDNDVFEKPVSENIDTDNNDIRKMIISFPGDEDEISRWRECEKKTRETISPALGIKDENSEKVLAKCVWSLSFMDWDPRVDDIVDMLYDGDFFDDVMDEVPEGKRKNAAIDAITSATDEQAQNIRDAIFAGL